MRRIVFYPLFALAFAVSIGLTGCGPAGQRENANTERSDSDLVDSSTNFESSGPITPTQQTGRVVAASEYKLSGPYTHGNLTVYLIHGPETLEGANFFTLQEGLEDKR